MSDIQYRSDMTVELVQSMASDESVVYAARVSTAGGTHDGVEAGEAKGLINFLMKNRHGSPFEHNAFTFYVEAPIFVFREFQRHRIASYNEESGRYKELAPVFYVPAEDRPLVQVGKAGSYEFVEGSYDQTQAVRWSFRFNSQDSYDAYQGLLEDGIAREVARMVLPLNIYSSMYVTMNARSLMNFLSLRTKREGSAYPSFPQREIEMVAEQIEEHFKALMPITYKAFDDNGRVAP